MPAEILATGVVFLFISIGLVILVSDNTLAIGTGWLTFLIGIILVLKGTLQGQPLKNRK